MERVYRGDKKKFQNKSRELGRFSPSKSGTSMSESNWEILVTVVVKKLRSKEREKILNERLEPKEAEKKKEE